MSVARLAALSAFALLACSSGSPPTGTENQWESVQGDGVSLEFQTADASRAPEILAHAVSGRSAAEAFFQRSLTGPVTLRLFPDRPSLTGYWRAAWNQPNLQPECWMIASADAERAVFLSPRIWSTDSCGHDGSNPAYVRRVIEHELIHVLHRRVNGAPGFVSQAEMWWFVEGVAVFGSGQLDGGARQSVRTQVTAGYAPASLQAALNGQNGYNVAGSIVSFIDATYGRATVAELLAASSLPALLTRLGKTESDLIASWRAFVLS